MEFLLENRTIAAIATPIGEGGVAMIRISGKTAFDIAQSIFSKDISSMPINTVRYGQILDSSKKPLDDVMLLKLKGPKSFTGEDTIEIFCHGGLLIQKKILSRCIEAGASYAQPGEFSYQSFMNGKLDLAQAEAIQQLIGAKNEYALKAAEDQLRGTLSDKIALFRNELIEVAAIIDAWVDYPEEGLEFKSQEELVSDLKKTYLAIEKLKNSFDDGRKIFHGIKLCLLGAPNAGKSSLMNALLGYERAIVTPIAGTTRDILQEDLNLFGMNFKLIDTAGIRETEEIIEKEGIKRSKLAGDDADLILFVIDSSETLDQKTLDLIETLPKQKTLLILNKSDLNPHPTKIDHFRSVFISAKNMTGLEDLKKAIEEKIWVNGSPSKEEVILTKERHHKALSDCLENLERVFLGFDENISCEFISFDLRMALKDLGSIIGFDLSESILDSIFSKFCVGK